MTYKEKYHTDEDFRQRRLDHNRKWREKHPEYLNEWRNKNREKYNDYMRAYMRYRRRVRWMEQ